MYRVKLKDRILLAEEGELLSRVLQRNELAAEHPCGGTGRCGKCKVLVDGKEMLSCQYPIHRDISVTLPEDDRIYVPNGTAESFETTENMCLVLDIGTTTLALALVSLDKKRALRTVAENNPQRAFGADIMSRIAYCQANGQRELHLVLAEAINGMIDTLKLPKPLPLFASGNSTMLHLFLDEDCRGIGTYPYTPVFLEGRRKRSFLHSVTEIETLPSLHSFIGADIVAGLSFAGMPKKGNYKLLVDLGTNAEIVLYSTEKTYCTAAAAGPAFEGCGIACGMSATAGAVSAISTENGKLEIKTIQNAPPRGICGTGLIDLVAFLLRRGILSRDGVLEDGLFSLTESVYVDTNDVRQLQLAKSAVHASILTLLRHAGVCLDEIEALYLAGGFSGDINVKNAAEIGLLPKELSEKCVSLGNSSLGGTVKYACERGDLTPYLKNASYINLTETEEFGELFMKNMMFH